MTDQERNPDGPVERPSAWLPPAATPATPPRWSPPAQPLHLPSGPPAPQPPQPRQPGAYPFPGGQPTTGQPPYDQPPSVPRASGHWPVRPAVRRRRSGCLWVLFVPVLCLILLVAVSVALNHTGSTSSRPPSPSSARSAKPPATPAETAWTITPKGLRADIDDPEFVMSLDGDFQSGYVAGEAELWLMLTGTKSSASTVLHAINPATGAERWKRALDGAICTTEAPKSGLLCASVLDRDQATGLGTRWQLHLLDPATGADRATRDIDGWLTAVHWTGGAFVLLEQREPAPHAVVQAFASNDLHPLWDRDLVKEPLHAELFSENRIIGRHEPDRPTLALDRPRIRDVGDGLIAVWAGQSTAFIDPADGRLVMFPHCSRLVDDGDRLWCNEVDGATAYSYAGKKMFRVKGPRLAFPDDDGRGVDQNRPVFIDGEGAAISVDSKLGTVGRAYTPPGAGSAFGNKTLPRASTVGDNTFLIGEAGAILLEPDADRTVWTNSDVTVSDLPVLVGDRVLMGHSSRDVVELAFGRTTARIRIDAIHLDQVGTQLAASGADQVSLVRVK